jgi:hypothetical protein
VWHGYGSSTTVDQTDAHKAQFFGSKLRIISTDGMVRGGPDICVREGSIYGGKGVNMEGEEMEVITHHSETKFSLAPPPTIGVTMTHTTQDSELHYR